MSEGERGMDTESAARQASVEGPTTSWETQGLRRWLEEAWRHGEIVADADGVLLEGSDQPRPDRFRPSHAGRH